MTEVEMVLVRLGEAIDEARKKYQQERHELLREFGTRLRETRELKKMTLRELARLVEVSPPFLSDVEHGRRALSPETMKKVLEHLDTENKDG